METFFVNNFIQKPLDTMKKKYFITRKIFNSNFYFVWGKPLFENFNFNHFSVTKILRDLKYHVMKTGSLKQFNVP